eukprot:1158271-Pelagomonas_calceolata.AAC.10
MENVDLLGIMDCLCHCAVVNIDIAKAQHAEFRNLLRSHGVRVLTVREILAYNVSEILEVENSWIELTTPKSACHLLTNLYPCHVANMPAAPMQL